jgi:hypothetical protein
MWIGFIRPTEDEWGISKLQDIMQHNQVYWKTIATSIRQEKTWTWNKNGKLQQTKTKVTKRLKF